MSTARWYTKANAYALAWREVFGLEAPKSAVVLGLAVAEHETHCGDSWPGENNWGACQLRALNAAEHEAVAGIPPHPSNVDEARAALEAHGLNEPKGGLHADYSPNKKAYYFVWFAKFATEAEGAHYCVHVLAEQRPTCRTVMTAAMGSEYELAEKMYASHYYEGFRNPKALYEKYAGAWHTIAPSDPAQGPRSTGAALNIADYAGALSNLTPGIRAALADWSAGDVAPVTISPDLASVLGQQQALNKLHVVTPALTEDGVRGPKTVAAIKEFQKAHGLVADGLIGPATTAALRAALK